MCVDLSKPGSDGVLASFSGSDFAVGPMTNEDSQEPRLSKFSNAGRGAFRQSQIDRKPDQAPPPLGEDAPLADLLEHAIRDRGFGDGAQGTGEPGSLPDKLIEELKTAQQQIKAEPLEYRHSLNEPVPPTFEIIEQVPASAPLAMPSEDNGPVPASGEAGRSLKGPATARLKESSRAAGAALAKGAKAVADSSARLSRRVRIRDWRRRRLALLSVVHRHVFDRNAEKLLFCKTPPLEVYHVEETEAGPEKSFVYQGPIPKKLLDWALSALPPDLKRYAFVDFRAGNGRTLLLAARHNFEYAAGYAFDAEGCETLEMNLAQYPRSYLSCRDVRALRGDRDGVTIPAQPAVLFFPDSLTAGHLDIILSYVTASLQLEPRLIYLIFENAGRERGREQMEMFERVPLPILNQAKTLLFGPVGVAVYRSKTGNAG